MFSGVVSEAAEAISRVGATEMAAIYDTVVRWNPATGSYDPRTAESLTPNADFTVWTLKLKTGIKFTDVTDYDADAVKFSLDRHRSGATGAPACEETRSCPRNDRASRAYMTDVKDIKVVETIKEGKTVYRKGGTR